ncbi:hypothetical protein BH10ACT6_BH10ACT6_07820 [soil metagenome]
MERAEHTEGTAGLGERRLIDEDELPALQVPLAAIVLERPLRRVLGANPERIHEDFGGGCGRRQPDDRPQPPGTLQRHPQRQERGRLPGAGLLFAGPDGGRPTNHNLRRAVGWDELRIDLGRPDLRIHDLRHTFATILFDAGASTPDVQATLGHSSLPVTERYSPAREGDAKRAGSVLDAAFGEGASSRSARSATGSRARKNGTEMAQAKRWEGGSGTRTRKTPDLPGLQRWLRRASIP